jgi:hypothetical protein
LIGHLRTFSFRILIFQRFELVNIIAFSIFYGVVKGCDEVKTLMKAAFDDFFVGNEKHSVIMGSGCPCLDPIRNILYGQDSVFPKNPIPCHEIALVLIFKEIELVKGWFEIRYHSACLA